MMKKDLKDLLDKAKRFIEKKDFDRLDSIFNTIYNLNDSNSIYGLALLLDDDYEFDEVMFSILHLIENFDDYEYVNQFIKVLPELYNTAPEWSRILVLRIINNKKTLRIFKILYRQQNSTNLNSIINKMNLPPLS